MGPQMYTYDLECNGRVIKKHADKMKAVPEVRLKKQELLELEKDTSGKRVNPPPLPATSSATVGV